MSVNNPYAQGGWSNPQNPWSINNEGGNRGVPPPSVFGALPFAAPRDRSPLLAFNFTALNPDILNSMVLGPHARHCFSISTSSATYHHPSVSLIRNESGNVTARIEWQQQPVVEIQNMVPRQSASQLITLSQDMSYRTMNVKGKPYAWVTHNGTIRIYNTAYNPAELVGFVSREPDSVSLNVAADAIPRGLLDVCVVVAVLLYSGRNID